MRRLILGTLALVVLAACHDGPTSIMPQSDLVQGNWVKDQTLTGSAESWTLTVNGDSVIGTGGWQGDRETGQLAVAGVIDGDSLHLRIRYFTGQATPDSIPRFWTRFDGVMISRTELSGDQRTPVTAPTGVRFYKTFLIWAPRG